MMGTIQAWLVGGLVVVGCFFLTVGTIGLLRFGNVYNRLHATSKPTTLGTAAIFLAGYVEFGPAGAGLPSLLGVLFLFITMPTGAHMISRAAQRMGVPFEPGVTWPEPPWGDPTSEAASREQPAVSDEAGWRAEYSDVSPVGGREDGRADERADEREPVDRDEPTDEGESADDGKPAGEAQPEDDTGTDSDAGADTNDDADADDRDADDEV